MVICKIHKAIQTLTLTFHRYYSYSFPVGSVGDQISRDCLGPVALFVCPTGNLGCRVSLFLALMSLLLPEYIIKESNLPKEQCKIVSSSPRDDVWVVCVHCFLYFLVIAGHFNGLSFFCLLCQVLSLFEQMPVSIFCLPVFTFLSTHLLHYNVLTLTEMFYLPASYLSLLLWAKFSFLINHLSMLLLTVDLNLHVLSSYFWLSY